MIKYGHLQFMTYKNYRLIMARNGAILFSFLDYNCSLTAFTISAGNGLFTDEERNNERGKSRSFPNRPESPGKPNLSRQRLFYLTNVIPASQRHTSVTPTSHQRPISVTPTSHQRHTSVASASHQRHSSVRPTSY